MISLNLRRYHRGSIRTFVAGLARCVDQVPAEVPAGLHLCYGDYGHQHFKQPESLALQVRVLNAVTAAAGRTVSSVSFTVPQYQREESYFAPLAGLADDPGTELNFALVPYHPADQAPGTTGDQVRLIDAAPGGQPRRDACAEAPIGVSGERRAEVVLWPDRGRDDLAAEADVPLARSGYAAVDEGRCRGDRSGTA